MYLVANVTVVLPAPPAPPVVHYLLADEDTIHNGAAGWRERWGAGWPAGKLGEMARLFGAVNVPSP